MKFNSRKIKVMVVGKVEEVVSWKHIIRFANDGEHTEHKQCEECKQSQVLVSFCMVFPLVQ